MKIIQLLLTCLLFTTATIAQTFDWAKSIGGDYVELVSSAVDHIGSVYTTGAFMGTMDFDPNLGLVNLTAEGEIDIFIQKLDAEGNLLWAKSMGGIGFDKGKSITIDDAGYVYVLGTFMEMVDFNPNGGSNNVTSAGQFDLFLQKLDTEGNLLWVKSIGGLGTDLGIDLTVDVAGYIYILGEFTDTVNFDPNGGTYNLKGTGLGGRDFFVLKLSPAGNLIWARSMKGSRSEEAYAMDVDRWGNVYITGEFSGTVDFDPSAQTFKLTATPDLQPGDWPVGTDAFLQKLDAGGNFQWVKRIKGTQRKYIRGYDLAIDDLGYIYNIGQFSGTVNFTPYGGNLYLTADSKPIFIQKVNPQGHLLWVKQMGGAGYAITVDGLRNIYTTGLFKDTVDFDLNEGIHNLTATGSSYDMFIQKLDTDGSLLWAKNMGGVHGFVRGENIVVKSNSIYVTGHFSNTADLDPSIDTTYLTALLGSWGDMFIQKFNSEVNTAPENPHYSKIKIYPNPNNGIFNIELPEQAKNAKIKIVDYIGRVVYQSKLFWSKNELRLSFLPAGIYYINLVLDTGEVFSSKMMLYRK